MVRDVTLANSALTTCVAMVLVLIALAPLGAAAFEPPLTPVASPPGDHPVAIREYTLAMNGDITFTGVSPSPACPAIIDVVNPDLCGIGVGDTVRITGTWIGGFHDITVKEIDNNGVIVVRTAVGTGLPDETIEFTATLSQYYYRCSVHSSMNGLISVAPAANQAPVAAAGPDQAVIEGENVTFDGSVSSDDVGITTYWWNFTDGTALNLTGPAPTYIFVNPGDFLVNLTVVDDQGLGDSDLVWINVTADQPPLAAAGPDQDVKVNESVTFDGSGSADDVGITTYWWNFTSDGEQSLTGPAPTYVFSALGDYVVTLTVQDRMGQTHSDTVTVNVTADPPPEGAPTNEPPLAVAGPDQNVSLGTNVTFDGSGSADAESNIAGYWWNFTDGFDRSLTGEIASHVFANLGVFLVTLTVQDDIGQTHSDTLTVTVALAPTSTDTTPPTADLEVLDIASPGTWIYLEGNSSTDDIGVVNWTWVFEDGHGLVTRYGNFTAHLFNVLGQYRIELTVRDAAGNHDLVRHTIVIEDIISPHAYAGDSLTVDPGTSVTLDGSESTDDVGVVNWSWSIPTEPPSVRYGPIITQVFDIPGVYVVVLEVRDAAGNQDLEEVWITVTDPRVDDPLTLIDHIATAVVTDPQNGTTTIAGPTQTDDGVAIVMWTWDLPGNEFVQAPDLEADLVPGIHTIVLEVTDALGRTGIKAFNVSIPDLSDSGTTPNGTGTGGDAGSGQGGDDGEGSGQDDGSSSVPLVWLLLGVFGLIVLGGVAAVIWMLVNRRG